MSSHSTPSVDLPHKKVVFVSGCYDILHAGHLDFFQQAKALGDHLIVCFAGDDSLKVHKGKPPSIPTAHKIRLLEALAPVDEVVVGDDLGEGSVKGLDFRQHFLLRRPNILAVTEDDNYGEAKRDLCRQVNAEYVILPKSLDIDKTSTSEILSKIRAPVKVPLRVDFAGGWLDVPKYARDGAFIVNVAITPLVSLLDWRYKLEGGLGGSAAYAMLQGRDSVQSELDLGVGWQDPAVVRETGLCVWRSGARPVLDFKSSGDMLVGRMGLLWSGLGHKTYEKTDLQRNYDLIEAAGAAARRAVLPGGESLQALAAAVNMSYQVQLGEGMEELPEAGELAKKYCGGGWGGYSVYLFADESARAQFLQRPDTMAVEPYIQ